ncbi:MAG: replicative DNA helicase [Polyangiaceae bacterium]|nr:replicative DNA helicase [Polyangiaceae bacterium]
MTAGGVPRVPPHDAEAEAVVLSAVLLGTDAFDRVQELLRAEHFYSDANQRVFEAVIDLNTSRGTADAVGVAGWLRDRGLLDRIGGVPYLFQLTETTPAAANLEQHARTVREKWRLRELIRACQRYAAEGYQVAGDVQAFIDDAEQAVFDVARIPEASNVQPVQRVLQDLFTQLSAAQARPDGMLGVPTGFTALDQKTSGLRPGELYIVAARPGMGKTSLVLNMAANIARTRRVAVRSEDDPFGDGAVEEPGWGVAFFSLEMPRDQVAARMLSSESRVDMQELRSGRLQHQWNRLTDAASRLSRLPIWIDDTPGLGLLDLRAKVRRLQAEISRSAEGQAPARGLGLVAVDYLQLMQGRQDASTREQEISEISRGLKRLAKELSVPVLALSQLNRGVETRNAKDKRPQLSDLRESGAIEQDADCILFIYRDDYYHDESPDQGIAELIIAKQRNGPTGVVRVRFVKECTRFDNLELHEYGEGELDTFDSALGA